MKWVMCVIAALVVASVFSSCKKDKKDEIDPAYVQKAEQFKTFVGSKGFRIFKYYSDKAIDYIEDDAEVRSETDLNRYISPWLKDDSNVVNLGTNKVEIHQNAIKISTDNSEVIIKDVSIGADKDGPYFYFLSHEYQPLKYRLDDFSGTSFKVHVDWHSGAKVYTEFHLITP